MLKQHVLYNLILSICLSIYQTFSLSLSLSLSHTHTHRMPDKAIHKIMEVRRIVMAGLYIFFSKMFLIHDALFVIKIFLKENSIFILRFHTL